MRLNLKYTLQFYTNLVKDVDGGELRLRPGVSRELVAAHRQEGLAVRHVVSPAEQGTVAD